MSLGLSVVIPVYNERPDDLIATLGALATALEGSPWRDPEVVLVDDGSDPPVDLLSVPGARLRVLRQPNQGRFRARQTGISAAEGEYVLLLDSRVSLDPAGLSWVAERVAAGERAWTGHCMMANPESPFARFWNVLTHSAFSEYLDDPRTTWFTLAEYDRFPKGTGHFLAPRSWLLDAMANFSSRYEDLRFSSDDTHMLRALAERDRIHISPRFASVYRNREALGPFLRHAIHRGTTFYDGFARRGTRFFPVVAGTFPASLAGLALAIRRPRLALAGAAAMSGAAAGLARHRRRPLAEAAAFGTLIVPFAIAFSGGVWRGALLAAKARLRP